MPSNAIAMLASSVGIHVLPVSTLFLHYFFPLFLFFLFLLFASFPLEPLITKFPPNFVF